MALQTLSWGIWPAPIYADGQSNMLLDASGEKAGAIWRVGTAGNIRKLHFRLGTVTTGDTLKVSLQDVSTTTGDPDEGVDQSGTVVIANGDDDVWKSVTLGSDRTVARGDWLAAVIEFDAYVAGNLNLVRDLTSTYAHSPAYVDLKTGGTWAKTGRMPLLGVEYDDGSFHLQLGLLSGMPSSLSVASNTAGADEYGIHFSLPFPARVAGIGFHSSLAADIDMVLYDSDGSTALQTVSWDASIQDATSLAARSMFFPASQALLANTNYRATIKPTTTTAVTFRYLEMLSAAARGQLPGGTNIQLTKRVDAGAWTEVSTQRPLMWLLLDQADDGAGAAGGLLRHPGMTGGCPA